MSIERRSFASTVAEQYIRINGSYSFQNQILLQMTLNSMGVMSVWGLAWGCSNLCQSLPSLLWPSVNDLLVCNQLSSSPHTTEVKAVALQTAVAFAPLVQLEREPDSLLVVTVSPTLTFQGWHVRVLVSTVCFDTIRPSTSTVLWQGCLWTRCELFKQLTSWR